MGSTYSLTMDAVSVTAAKTVAWIRPSTTRSIEILRVEVSNSGAATSAQQGVQLRVGGVGSIAVTSTTPVCLDHGGPASTITGGTSGAAGTSGTNATVEPAAGDLLYSASFNAPVGWSWVAGPDDRIVVPASSSEGFYVKLSTNPTTTSGWHCTVIFREL